MLKIVHTCNHYDGNTKGNFILPNYKQKEQFSNDCFMKTRLVMLKSISAENEFQHSGQNQIIPNRCEYYRN